MQQNHLWSANFHMLKKLLVVAIIPVSWQVIISYLFFDKSASELDHVLICDNLFTASFYLMFLYRFWWALYLGFKWKWLPWHRVSFLFLELVTMSFLFSTFPFPFFSFYQVFWFFKSFLSRSSYAIHLPEKVQGPFLESSVVQVSCGWKHTAAISGKLLSSHKKKEVPYVEYFFSCQSNVKACFCFSFFIKKKKLFRQDGEGINKA